MNAPKLKLLFAVTSIGLLIVLGIAPTKDYFSEWRSTQHKYNEYLETIPQKRIPEEIGLKQRWNEDLDQVDRCTTCHLGVDDPALAEAPQPFTAHPEIYHDPLDISCTTCHQGQGLATTEEKAHGLGEYWDEPLLPVEYLEASCGKCHDQQEVPGAPVLSKGRKLVSDLNCTGCHKLGESGEQYFAPSLDGIAKKTTRQWLIRWLKQPHTVRPDTEMPDFKLSDTEAELLVDFLMTNQQLPGNANLKPLPETLKSQTEDQSFISEGKSLFRQARCISCHSVEGRGGTLAPELGKVGSKVNLRWLYNYLEEPQRLEPGVPMPAYGFTDSQRGAVTAYMMSEFRDWGWTPDSSTHRRDPEFYSKGLKLFKSYNCGGCHELSGVEGSSETGPDLTGIGPKPLYKLDFGELDSLPHTRTAFIYAKLKSPRSFREGLRMPEFSLNERELQAVTTALLAQSDWQPLPKYQPVEPRESSYDPEGPLGRMLDRYRCLGCHEINGSGGNIAPSLSGAGSRLRREWTRRYFEVPYSLRPIMTERMPNLFMPEEDQETLLRYFSLMLRDDSLENLTLDLTDTTLIATGRELYAQESCSSCHQIDGKGGYVGPPLDKAGDRLKPGWVYRWLQHPRKYQPETLEPNRDFDRRELEALTAFIMSLEGEQP